MSALQLIEFASYVLYVVIFALTAAAAVRHPSRAAADIALFFGITTVIVFETILAPLFGGANVIVTDIVVVLALALPYVLLRLVADFTQVPTWVVRAAELALVAVALAWIVSPAPQAEALVVLFAAYFVTLSAYCATQFIGAALRSVGVTRRRMQAVAAGTLLIGGDVLLVGVTAVAPVQTRTLLAGAGQLFGLLSAIAYFVGFAPPRFLKRAWQEPELRAFLQRAASLPRFPDTRSIVAALERGAGSTLGARATIGIYDPAANVLHFEDPHEVLPNEVGPSRFLVWRVFEEQSAA